MRELPAGKYRVLFDTPELRDPAAEKDPGAPFEVLPPENTEMLDLSSNPELLQAIAEQSGGRLYTPETVEQLTHVVVLRGRHGQAQRTRFGDLF